MTGESTKVCRRWWWFFVLVVIAFLAPLLANDVPLVARVDGDLRWPAFASYFGGFVAPPDVEHALTWKEWWVRLPEESADFAWMPPWPYGPDEVHLDQRFATPSFEHPLGNDAVGRDVFARLLHGMWIAVMVGFGAMLLAGLIGIPLGLWAGGGYRIGEWTLRWLTDITLCSPTYFVVVAALAFLGHSMPAVILVLAAVLWVGPARILRGELLSLREREFVHAARGAGVSGPRRLFRHLLPSALGPLRVELAFVFAEAVVLESTLAFLGLVPSAEHPSWGVMLAHGTDAASQGAWHLWLFPVLALSGLVGLVRLRLGRR